MNQKCFYVYVHRRLADGTAFYVGKGKGKRLLHSHNKSIWWNSIAAKNGWYAEKERENMSEPCAYTFERLLIFANKGKLCNLAEGGVGGSGFRKKTAEHIAKVALFHVGRKRSQSTRDKISEKATERLSDPKNHWHFRPKVSLWKHIDGSQFEGNHLELSQATGFSLGSLKRVQSGSMKHHKGWSCHDL